MRRAFRDAPRTNLSRGPDGVVTRYAEKVGGLTDSYSGEAPVLGFSVERFYAFVASEWTRYHAMDYASLLALSKRLDRRSEGEPADVVAAFGARLYAIDLLLAYIEDVGPDPPPEMPRAVRDQLPKNTLTQIAHLIVAEWGGAAAELPDTVGAMLAPIDRRRGVGERATYRYLREHLKLDSEPSAYLAWAREHLGQRDS
jgi:hypothetical protein